MSKINRMFWDIETVPNLMYAWRCGNRVSLGPDDIYEEGAICCICWKWEDKTKVHSLVWNGSNDDKHMIEQFREEAYKADEMVAHWGDHFDMPWFQGRLLYYHLQPLPIIKTVDTCSIARHKFRFNSYKLDYLGKVLLGKQKLHTDFELWKKVKRGNKQALKYMVKYCKEDVRLLQDVYYTIAPFCKSATHIGVLNGFERWTCPQCGSADVIKKKIRVTATGMTRHQMLCKTCGKYYTIPNNIYVQYTKQEV